MKKTVSVILALATLCCLYACGKEQDESRSESNVGSGTGQEIVDGDKPSSGENNSGGSAADKDSGIVELPIDPF